MSELFKLKPCEECNWTGDAHSQGHDYDCPDCLGTGFEEPAKRIMNLELMLNQHKETLKSSDAHNNELAQKFEIALEQRDRLAVALNKCRDRVTGECHPNWHNDPDTFRSRDYIADVCEQALQSLTTNSQAQPPKAD